MHRSERRTSPARSRPLRCDPAAVGPPPMAARSRAFAGRARRPDLAGRFDPEATYSGREEIGWVLRCLGRETTRAVGGCWAATPAPPDPAKRDTAAVPCLRALLAAHAVDVERLLPLVVQVVRPVRQRYRRLPGEDQLLLPLLGNGP